MHQHDSARNIHACVLYLLSLPPTQSLHPTSGGCQRALGWVPCIIQKIPTGYLFLHMVMHMFQCYSCTLSHLLLPLLCPRICLYVCVSLAALQIGSLVLFFNIPYICINIQYLFFAFWFTSVCKAGSRFIHLSRIDSNSFSRAELYSIV